MSPGSTTAQDLERVIGEHGDRIACFIVEPFLGVGGFIAASKEYLELARRLTAKRGILLIFDEIISGFRFRPGGVQTFYGVRPDLTTLGKVIGGGHAVAAVVGPSEIMETCECGPGGSQRVYFEGGTFSAHSEYMKAGLVMLGYLAGHAATVYPRLARAGERLRRGIESVFAEAGIEARCTGDGNDIVPGSSLFMVHFPRLAGVAYDRPEDIHDGRRSDLPMREDLLKLALLVERRQRRPRRRGRLGGPQRQGHRRDDRRLRGSGPAVREVPGLTRPVHFFSSNR